MKKLSNKERKFFARNSKPKKRVRKSSRGDWHPGLAKRKELEAIKRVYKANILKIKELGTSEGEKAEKKRLRDENRNMKKKVKEMYPQTGEIKLLEF